MKACFFGNSHLVAMKDGLTLGNSPLSGNVTFIAPLGPKFELPIGPDGTIPIPPNTRLSYAEGIARGDLRLADYDAFAVVGLGFGPHPCAHLHRQWRLANRLEHRRRLISRPALTATVAAMLADTPALRLLAHVRVHTTRPIFIVPTPTPASRLRDARPTTAPIRASLDLWRPLFDDAVAMELHSVYVAAAEKAAAQYGAVFLDQPEATREPFFTREDYRLAYQQNFYNLNQQPVAAEEYWHANAQYGLRVMADIEGALGLVPVTAPGAPADAPAAAQTQALPEPPPENAPAEKKPKLSRREKRLAAKRKGGRLG